MAKTSAKLVRLDTSENRQIEEEAKRLGLSVAELLRRSLRVALPIIKAAQVPGARVLDETGGSSNLRPVQKSCTEKGVATSGHE